MTPTEASQPRPFSNYDPTKYRSAHLRAAVALCFLFGFLLSGAALIALTILLGLGAWRQIVLGSVGAFIAPFLVLALPALNIVNYLSAHYHIDARPEATMKRAAPAASTAPVQLTVSRPRPPAPRLVDVRPAPAPELPMQHVPGLPAPSSIQEEIITMPRLERPDPETGYTDVPALDVRYFILHSTEGHEPGTPALRDWLGHTLPSGKQMTRRYWEKLTDIAVKWGRLYKGASGEASRILPENVGSEPKE